MNDKNLDVRLLSTSEMQDIDGGALITIALLACCFAAGVGIGLML